jgi:hypothetical protein
MTDNEIDLIAAIKRLLALPAPPQDYDNATRHRYAMRVRESAERTVRDIEAKAERKPR